MTLKEQKQQEFKRVSALIDKDKTFITEFYNTRYVEFVDIYSKKYFTTKSIIQEYLKSHNIKKTSEEVEQQRQKTNYKLYGAGSKPRKKIIDYTLLKTLYVDQMLSVADIVSYFNGQYSEHDVRDNLHRQQIKRPRTGNPNYKWANDTARHQRTEATCLEKYGVKHPMQDEQIINKGQETKQRIYGEDWSKIIYNKACETTYARYGVKNIFEDYAYIQSKIIAKFGVEHISKTQEFKEAMHSYWENLSADKYIELVSKRVQTLTERYGGTGFGSPVIRLRIEKTMLDTYGVINAFQLPQNQTVQRKVKYSKPNENFFKLACEYFSPSSIEREFAIANRQYDFKIGNWLIEINPWVTHNSSWSPFGQHTGLAFDYHFNKSKLATDHGFTCINVFDWVDPRQILEFIVKNNIPPFSIIYSEPQKIIFDTRLLQIVQEESETSVVIYDDGSNILDSILQYVS